MGDYNIDMTKTDAHPLKLINTLIRLSRKMYYSQKLENNKNNVNGLWDTVNDLTGKNKKDSSNIFHDNGQQLTNPNDIRYI